MLAILAANNYLGFGGPDMTLVYMLVAAIAAVALAMAFFRSLGRIKDRRQLQKSSWKTFEKVAKVKGLSRLEIDILRSVIEGAKVKRPSQVLGTITLFDKCVDRSLDRDLLSDAEQATLEKVRNQLVTATVAWDGRQSRREFERAACGFDIQIKPVTKERLDEELKSSYEEADPKFLQAFDGIAEDVPPMGARVIDLSAGGMALLTQDKDIVNEDDYVGLASGADPAPFDVNGIRGKILRTEQMKDQGQVILHVSFLPYEQELRREIIRVVYDSEASSAPKAKATSKAKKGKAVKKKTPVAKRKAKEKEGVELVPQATSDAGESLQ